jgi:hypothetical protein
MKLELTASDAEVNALNALEYAMTSSGLTEYPRVFYKTSTNDLRIILYKKDCLECVEGVKAYLELKVFLDFAGVIAAEKLELKNTLAEVIGLVFARR